MDDRPPCLVGVLLSTSAIRISVYDTAGDLIESGEASLSEQTTVGWERAFRDATPELPETGICSVASTSGTALLVDEYGEPVFPPQMYYESTPDSAAELREAVHGAENGGWDIALSPTAPLPKIARLKADHPDRFTDVEWVLSPTTWLLYRLYYGSSTRWRNVETDWTNALKFGADISPSIPEWNADLFAAADLSTDLLPAIRPPGSFISIAEGELARRTGLDGFRLFQGLTDGNAYVLANGCIGPGDFSVTFGETSVVKYVSDSINPHEALYHHRHPLDGYLSGASFDSGKAFEWFCEHVLDATPERGFELARSVPPGEEYEVFLPGNRAPFYDPGIGMSALDMEYEMSRSTEEVQGRLARGLATGIVLTEWSFLSIIEDHFDTEIGTVRAMYSGAPGDEGRDWWSRMRASVWNRQLYEMEARAAAGLLVPATLIASVYDDAVEATDTLLSRRATVDPDPEIHREYERERAQFFDRWQRVTDLSDRG